MAIGLSTRVKQGFYLKIEDVMWLINGTLAPCHGHSSHHHPWSSPLVITPGAWSKFHFHTSFLNSLST